MRTLFTFALLATLAVAGTAAAVIDWAGNAYPNSGDIITATDPGGQFVVAQVYKGGVTDGPGQGADLTATLFYTTDLAPETSVPMAYNTDIGSNDEYIGYVPQADLLGAAWVDVRVVFDDLSDVSFWDNVQDQNGADPPLHYVIADVTPVDIDVTFTICMEGVVTAGPVCVIGGNPAIGDWSAGAMMNNVSGDIWEITVTFLAGSNPSVPYKYRKDVCQTWESTADRFLNLPTDGTTAVIVPPDSWEFAPLGCGLGNVLSEDKTVCIQVCLEGVWHEATTCVTGSLPELTNWGTGVVMHSVGGELYQTCLVFPQGSPYPINAEFKFRKDGCETWESVPNRMFTVDDASPVEQTLTYSWDDGPGMCDVVPNEQTSWGTLKGLYR